MFVQEFGFAVLQCGVAVPRRSPPLPDPGGYAANGGIASKIIYEQNRRGTASPHCDAAGRKNASDPQIKTDFSTLDRRAVLGFVYAAVGLTCITYLKDPKYLQAILAETPWAYVGDEAAMSSTNNLYALIWWVLCRLLLFRDTGVVR
ncbi:MAG: hypothetical protein IPG58_09795 [Acidobacteria bacterium]|nr:hypothetical protein [Acidobacteriota bacterium]